MFIQCRPLAVFCWPATGKQLSVEMLKDELDPCLFNFISCMRTHWLRMRSWSLDCRTANRSSPKSAHSLTESHRWENNPRRREERFSVEWIIRMTLIRREERPVLKIIAQKNNALWKQSGSQRSGFQCSSQHLQGIAVWKASNIFRYWSSSNCLLKHSAFVHILLWIWFYSVILSFYGFVSVCIYSLLLINLSVNVFQKQDRISERSSVIESEKRVYILSLLTLSERFRWVSLQCWLRSWTDIPPPCCSHSNLFPNCLNFLLSWFQSLKM